MVDCLKAEEALEGVMVAAVAFGSLKQGASDAQMHEWRQAAKTRQTRARPVQPEQLAGMGIGMIKK